MKIKFYWVKGWLRMTKLQKQKHIDSIVTYINSIPGITETRFGNLRLQEKQIAFQLKDNNLRIEKNGHCIFSKPWVSITLEEVQKLIDRINK